MGYRLFFLITICIIIPSKTVAITYAIDQLTFNVMPAHCQAFYAELQLKGKSKGLVLKNPGKYNWKLWSRRIGNPAIYMNHYCPGLAALYKAKLSSSKRKNLNGIGKDIEYLINRSKWSPSNAWLRAEAHMKLAELAELQGNITEAVTRYQKSINIYPKNYRAYLGLAKLLKNTGNSDEALKVIRQGLKQVPKSKSLKRQEQRLSK